MRGDHRPLLRWVQFIALGALLALSLLVLLGWACGHSRHP